MSEREMPALGPTRDALIARVLDLRRCKCDDPDYCFRGRTFPPYSTDDKAALDVLKEMQRQGWNFTIDGGFQSDWYIGIFRGRGEPGGVGDEPTFADAVTAAAIRAKWAEQEATR